MSENTLLMIGNYLESETHYKNIWHYLAERLSKNGWHVITTSSKENQILRLIDMLKTVWVEREQFSAAQVDVFSGKAFIFAEFCVHLLRYLNKPIVLTLHGGGLTEFAEKNPKRMAHLLSAVDQVVTPSVFLQKNLRYLRDDIRLIPNPIDLSEVTFKLREEVKPNIVWVRAFDEIYNPGLAVTVLKALESHYPDSRLIMVGPEMRDGSLRRTRQRIHKLHLEKKVEITGRVAHRDIPMWLARADIFINTSNYDAAPRSLLEAMANGLCVVSTNVGGIPYIITDGKEGFLVPPCNSQAMIEAILRILSEPGLGSRFSRNAHKRAQAFDWKIILPQWEALFVEVVSNSSG